MEGEPISLSDDAQLKSGEISVTVAKCSKIRHFAVQLGLTRFCQNPGNTSREDLELVFQSRHPVERVWL